MIWLSKEALTPYGDNGVKYSVYHKFSKIISNKLYIDRMYTKQRATGVTTDENIFSNKTKYV